MDFGKTPLRSLSLQTLPEPALMRSWSGISDKHRTNKMQCFFNFCKDFSPTFVTTACFVLSRTSDRVGSSNHASYFACIDGVKKSFPVSFNLFSFLFFHTFASCLQSNTVLSIAGPNHLGKGMGSASSPSGSTMDQTCCTSPSKTVCSAWMTIAFSSGNSTLGTSSNEHSSAIFPGVEFKASLAADSSELKYHLATCSVVHNPRDTQLHSKTFPCWYSAIFLNAHASERRLDSRLNLMIGGPIIYCTK